MPSMKWPKSRQKNQNKKGFGAAPQWEISVSFMRMGFVQHAPQQPENENYLQQASTDN